MRISKESYFLRTRILGVPWSGYCWLRCLQTAGMDAKSNVTAIQTLLGDFNLRFMDDICRPENCETFASLVSTIIFCSTDCECTRI